MPQSIPRQPGAWRPTIECLEARQVPSTLSAVGHGHNSDAVPVEAVVQHEPPGKVDALAPPSDSSSYGRGHDDSGAPGEGRNYLRGADGSLALMGLPDEHGNGAP